MKNVDIIEKSAADGVSILSRINDFTKSKNHIEFGEINIGDIISDTIEMTKPKWAHGESGKKIDVKFSSAGNLNLSGDRAMIVEVFSNLLHNAIDAIEAEGIIRISAYGNEEEIVAEVEDNGAGMDAQTLKKIFDPFFTTKSRQGTGLGLAMVYSIIDSHKGKITAESEIGKGTRFVIILPKHIDQNLSSALSVLVVEDDENLRNVLSELLDEINAKAMLAKNCHEALEILKCNRFDMVFTDLGLPDEDGWVIIDAVKESSPESFIVPMTGWNKEIERKELIARGLTNVLLKPFTLEQVSNLIDSYVQRKKDVHNIA